MGLAARRCIIDGALATCWKRRGVGRMVVAGRTGCLFFFFFFFEGVGCPVTQA